MARTAWVLVAAALAGRALAAGPVSHGPRQLGEVTLSELVLREGKLAIRVDSGGCTDRPSIRPRVERAAGREGVPHHLVTFERVRVDECKAISDEGVLLDYDVARDLGITGLGTLSVANAVLPRSQSSIVEEFALRRALKESTLRAAALEIQGYREREKAARDEPGSSGDAERFLQRAAGLEATAAALRAAHLNDYPSPVVAPGPAAAFAEDEGHGPVLPARKVMLRVKVTAPCAPGSQLEVEGTSRSGPFFHAAGGPLDRLEVGHTYQVTAYLVFRREYFGRMTDHYVHVAEVR